MKRILATALTLTLVMFIQAQTTVTFMGVPVKGNQKTFTQKLLKKGCYTDKNSVLKGIVDGALSTIIVNTVNDEVKSVTAIEDERLADEHVAVSRFNYLIDYYKAKRNYDEYESNTHIEDTDLATMQKYISEEYYYAEFFQTAKNQRYTKRMGFKVSDKSGGYRIVRQYDNNYDIDMKLPK